MRIAVSGSYSTGKTITTMVLSELTGLPKTHARTMRELLPVTFPGKRLETCLPEEMIELIMRRNFERVTAECDLGHNFISDGASIQEWAYCYARIKCGFNPNENRLKSAWKKYTNYTTWYAFKDVAESYGNVVKAYAKKNYDLIVHLPVEFPLDPDGHRPVKERFRQECDRLLRVCYNELNIPVFEVSGSIHDRAVQICSTFNLPYSGNIDDIIAKCSSNKKKFFDSIKLEASLSS